MALGLLLFFGLSLGFKVDLVSPSLTSHLLSMKGVLEALQARGHEATFLSFEESRGVLAFQNASSFGSLGPWPAPHSAYQYTHTLPSLLELVNDYSMAAWRALQERYADPARRPHILVFDCFFPVGWPVCEQLDVRCVCLLCNSVGLELLGSEYDSHPAIVSGRSAADIAASLRMRLANFLDIRAARHLLPLFKAFKLRRFWRLVGRALPPLSSPAGVSEYMVSNAAFGLAPAHAFGPLVQVTGPWLPRSSPGLEPAVQAFLDGSQRFVFLSIGTNAEWDCGEARLFTAAMAETARRGLHVLWSVKRYQREACNIVGGPGVLLVDFVDQLAVLRHPRVAAFVSHCGFSSLQEAIYYRVPLVAFAAMLQSDQPSNARRVSDAGIGINLREQPLSAEAVVAAVFFAADDPGVRARVERFAALVTAQGGAERVAQIVEAAHAQGVEHLRLTPETAWDVIAVLLAVPLAVWWLLGERLCRRKAKTN